MLGPHIQNFYLVCYLLVLNLLVGSYTTRLSPIYRSYNLLYFLDKNVVLDLDPKLYFLKGRFIIRVHILNSGSAAPSPDTLLPFN